MLHMPGVRSSVARMDRGPLAQEIITAFDGMPPQIRSAARYVLDRPRDVALLSMREQSRHAGVKPATMTRLAKHLGYDGYEQIRRQYAAAVRSGDIGFAGKVGSQIASQKLEGDRALVQEMLEMAGTHLASLAAGQIDRILAVAERLHSARRVYSLGLRSSHAAAWQLHYILSLIGERSYLLDGIAGTGPDALRGATDEDVLLSVSIAPYTRHTVELARHAARRGIRVLTITDSEVAPLAAIAEAAVIVPTGSPSFFHTMMPACMIAEILGALVAGRQGEAALQAMRRTDRYFADLNIHSTTRNGAKAR